MANPLENYSNYLYDIASELHSDATSCLEKLRNSNISRTKLTSIEEQVNKLILFKKPPQPETNIKFNAQCTTIYQPYFETCKNLFFSLLKIESTEVLSKDLKTATTLAKVNLEYCQKKSLQPVKKVEKKPPKPEITENISLIDYMTEKGLVGLPDNLDEVLRPIIARGHLKEVRNRRNITFDKGIILFGPPGTGKTSFVRNLADYLGCEKENVQLISAPELVSSLVGKTEGNIRDRFKPSIEAWEKFGEKSPLFILAIDEFENLALNRESSENDWNKRSVVQLLTSLDGFLQQKNVLVIGITNHIDMIDPALLRNGRFGNKIKIGLPNADARKAILNLYLQDIKDYLDEEVKLDELIEKTEGFSGADLKGIVESANRIAYNRYSVAWTATNDEDETLGKIRVEDFTRVIEEIKSHKVKKPVKSFTDAATQTEPTPPPKSEQTEPTPPPKSEQPVSTPPPKKVKVFNFVHWAKQNVDYSTLEEVDLEPKASFGTRLYNYLKGSYCIIEHGKIKKLGFFGFIFEQLRVLLGFRDRTIRVAAKIDELRALLVKS